MYSARTDALEPSQAWIEALGDLRDAGRACAMVVVTEVKGSAPREAGTRMLVSDGGLVWGTIGGGNLEKQAIEHASELLGANAAVSETVAYPLAEKTGQCCGGQVTLFFETFHWQRRTVAVFGAGHVGQALGGLAPWLKADLLLIDGRDEAEIVPRIPAERAYELRCIDAPEAEVATLPEDALILVMTHSHALDLEILEEVLKRGGFPFVGLIGSARKWQRFRERLLHKGFAEELVDSIQCPIGVSRGSKDPAAIALSTATQLADLLESLPARA